MQIYRLFEIIYILLHEKLVTARSLAERFEVSQRTIYRDIEILSMSGIPVYTEKGKGGGISLLPDFVLNKSLLSEQEHIEMLSALQRLSNIKTPDTDQVLSKLTKKKKKNAANWLEVDFSYWSYDNSELFNSFKTAILERRIAEFDYYSAYGKKTREKTYRRNEPIQIWFKSKSWYIKGFCLTRQAIRTFKMTRIGNLKISPENFTERDLSLIPPPGNTDEEQKPSIKIKLKIKSEAADRVLDQFGDDMIDELLDGSFVVTVYWPEDQWVYGVILSYGESIKVLEPEHIRETLRIKLIKMLDNFS
jgi:predicted DNA-binding transcriptional regulator YafY